MEVYNQNLDNKLVYFMMVYFNIKIPLELNKQNYSMPQHNN
jgi:hypothetical protein